MKYTTIEGERWLIASPEISRRDQFGALLNARGLLGQAVEVGVHRGEFAEQLLATWSGRRLHCVDPWQDHLPDYDGHVPESNRIADLGETIGRLSAFGDRAAIHQRTSSLAAPLFPDATLDATLDFCYLDANHRRRYVEQDIRLWWPKIRPGGILAGHDISGFWQAEVEPAVVAFARRLDRRIYLVPDRRPQPASWYVYKAKEAAG